MTESAMNMKAKKYLELKAEYDALEEQLEKLKEEMQGEMNGAELFETNKYTFKWPVINKINFDTKTFKVKHPDLYNIFTSSNSYRKFSVVAKA